MLVIKDLEDLKKYLETRREMIAKQHPLKQWAGDWKSGCLHGFDEAIKAVEALMNYEEATPLASENDSESVQIGVDPAEEKDRLVYWCDKCKKPLRTERHCGNCGQWAST